MPARIKPHPPQRIPHQRLFTAPNYGRPARSGSDPARVGERGTALVSFLIISVVFWSTIFMSIQVAIWGYSHHVAASAARQAAQRVATETGTASAGNQFATDFVTSAAGSWIQDLNVTSTRDTTTAEVTVTGTGLELIPIPFWDLRIEVTASDPVERFVPANE